MGEDAPAPLPGHVHAPFFTRLARINLEETVPLNNMLLDQVAELCVRLLVAAPTGLAPIPPEALVDLLTWSDASMVRLRAAFERLGVDPRTAPIVPLAGPMGGWGSLNDVFAWEDGDRTLFTTAHLREHADVPIVVALTPQRRARLDRSAQMLAGRGLTPADADVAGWAERIAEVLAGREFDAETWGRFYDELAGLVRDRQVLAGRRILVDDDGQLRRCNVRRGDADSAVAFFSPRADVDTRSVEVRLPPGVSERVFFVSQQIAWTQRTGVVNARRPGRRMLEDGLVHEYRAGDLLPVVSAVLRRNSRLAGEILLWTFRFALSHQDPPWHEIRAMRLLVPTRDGRWIEATKAVLSAEWGGEDTRLLGRFLDQVGVGSAELNDLRDRLTLGPHDAPFRGLSVAQMREFLVRVGVRAGLNPEPTQSAVLRADGRYFQVGRGISPRGLPQATAAVWQSAVRQHLPQRPLKPYTPYESRTPFYRIPGQDDHAEFSPDAKLLYAQLIALGLSHWPDEALSVKVYAYNNPRDMFTLPTPAAAFITEVAWLPVSTPGQRGLTRHVRMTEAWAHTSDAPPFVPVVIASVRRPLLEHHAKRRATTFGLRLWDDPSTAAERVQLLTALLEGGEVADTALPQFRNVYEDAWITAIDRSTAGTPLDGGKRAPIVVTRGARMEVVDLRGDHEIVYVQDGDHRQSLQLLDQSGAAVFAMRHARAAQVGDRLAASFGDRIRLISSVEVGVYVDGQEFVPSADPPLLIGPDMAWVVDLIASAIELRSSRFRRTSAETLRRAITRLRRTRVVMADRIEAQVDGRPVATGEAETRRLAFFDDQYPTVIVLRRAPGDAPLGTWQIASTPVAELLGYPELADTIRVAFAELADAGYSASYPPDSRALAKALDLPAARVDEIRMALRAPDDVAFSVLIPLVAVWSIDRARSLQDRDSDISPAEIAQWLASQSTVDVAALLVAANDGDLDRARLLLGVDLPRLNAAIRELGAPYQELANPDGVTQQWRSFVSSHHHAILLRLRRAFLNDYRDDKPLDGYVERRDLTALTADPAWASEHLRVPEALLRARVNDWLCEAGAVGLDDDVEAMESVEALRRDNRATVLAWADRAATLVRAHILNTIDLPGSAIAEELIASGLLDFEPVSDVRFLGYLRRTGRWPQSMVDSLDPAANGLPATVFDAAAQERAEARRRREEERRSIVVDGRPVLAEESNYVEIVKAVKAGITEQFRATPASPSLVPLPQAPPRRQRSSGTGGTAGRRPVLSDIQIAAIGLVGEVAALEWVMAQHPGVSVLDAWVSGYRNLVLGDGRGDDSCGYDIVVDEERRRILYEVKASDGYVGEFVLTHRERERARTLKRREQYKILLVTNALDSDQRRIHVLPNPCDPKYAKYYREVGEGVRYRFDLGTA